MERYVLEDRPVSVEDVAAVAAGRRTVIVDGGMLSAIEASCATCHTWSGETEGATTAGSATVAGGEGAVLSVEQGRAALFGLLVQLCRSARAVAGKPATVAIRPALLTALATALNDVAGVGAPRWRVDALTEGILSTLRTGGLELTAVEVEVIRTAATGAWAAVAALAAHTAHSLAVLADGVAAVTLEAAEGTTDALDGDWLEAARPHTSVLAAASSLSLLLDGSRNLGGGSAAGKAAPSPATPERSAALHAVASIHGASTHAIAYAVRAAMVDVNAVLTLPVPQKGGAARPVPGAKAYHAAPVTLPLLQATTAVTTLAAASHHRTVAALAAGAVTPTQPPMPTTVTHAGAATVASSHADAMAAALQLHAAADDLRAALGAEWTAAERVLSDKEVVAAKAAVEKEERRAKAAAEREAAEAAKAASMSPEERAKHEAMMAKRKEKAAAGAAGGAGAGAVDGGGDGKGSNVLNLAPGVAQWRQFTRSLAGPGASIGEVVAAALAPIAFAPGVKPPAAGTPAAFLRALTERLGAGSGGKRKVKVPKGARDFLPEQMEVREKCFGIIRGVFKRHGGVEIDTPVFELKETLLGKYGDEGGKLIYDLADQGGELLSLRYDLTVPFARFIALHGIDNIKRYHIARVYRRDLPNVSKGRFREFYQCDFDVAGVYAPMMPDAEVISVAAEILGSLPIGNFTIKLNHRGLLDAVLDIAGVPASKFRPICSAIDKLDKEPWSVVREEMVTDKGLPPAVADRIGEMVVLSGAPLELHAKLTEDGVFGTHAGATAALGQLKLLFGYLQAMGSLHRVTFDLSLARGLDYYTGVIYEAVLLDSTIGVGSIAAGGRYDNLVGMFSASGTPVPCVGVSIGVERVFAIMEARAKMENGGLARTPVTVLVTAIPSARYNMTLERMKMASALWKAGVGAEMVYAVDPKLQKQVTVAAESGIPYTVVLGEDELDKGEVQLKDMAAHKAVNVKVGEVVPTLLAWMGVAGDGVKAAPNAEDGPAPSAPTPAPPAAGGAGATTAGSSAVSVAVVTEGGDRGYGRFTRPAVPILPTSAPGK